MIQKTFLCSSACALFVVVATAGATTRNVSVDINLDVKHVVRGVSDFNRKKHITVHANVFEGDWKGQDAAKHYLMNELDVYFGRDNGNASWFFGYTPQDPDKPDANEGDRIAWQRVYDSMKSDIWSKDVKRPFAQWDYVWKGFIDAAGENMDFYSIHFYDWVNNGEKKDPLAWGKYRYGGPVEAVFEMVEWYQQHRFGKHKPWVISEYGSICGPLSAKSDYRWGDWTHVQSFNWMFMQFLRRPDVGSWPTRSSIRSASVIDGDEVNLLSGDSSSRPCPGRLCPGLQHLERERPWSGPSRTPYRPGWAMCENRSRRR